MPLARRLCRPSKGHNELGPAQSGPYLASHSLRRGTQSPRSPPTRRTHRRRPARRPGRPFPRRVEAGPNDVAAEPLSRNSRSARRCRTARCTARDRRVDHGEMTKWTEKAAPHGTTRACTGALRLPTGSAGPIPRGPRGTRARTLAARLRVRVRRPCRRTSRDRLRVAPHWRPRPGDGLWATPGRRPPESNCPRWWSPDRPLSSRRAAICPCGHAGWTMATAAALRPDRAGLDLSRVLLPGR